MTPAPELVDRFRADLTAVWPEGTAAGAKLGLAVSGGGDSLALLLLAQAALPGRIAVATVDHGLRPESTQEAAMVAAICRDLGVQHDTLRVTLDPGNVQHRARAARYRALAAWCRGNGLHALATGHQLDDQAETLVMRLNRGSGLGGLAGVRARGTAPGSNLALLRPLLGWRRTELDRLARNAGLTPVCDPSNGDSSFDRVRIRQALAGAAWLDPAMLARSAALLAEAERHVAQTIDSAFERRVVVGAREVRLTPGGSDFEAVELALRIIAQLAGSASRNDVAALVARLRRGENASLGGVLARPEGQAWVFGAEPPRRAD